jgi:hypothetical protein
LVDASGLANGVMAQINGMNKSKRLLGTSSKWIRTRAYFGCPLKNIENILTNCLPVSCKIIGIIAALEWLLTTKDK